MKLKSLIPLIALTLAVHSNLAAQVSLGSAGGFSRYPFHKKGEEPEVNKATGALLFRSIESGQLVLRYLDDFGQAKSVQIEAPRTSRPVAFLSVIREGSDRYRYQYTVTNDPGSTAAVRAWSLIVPSHVGATVSGQPPGWRGIERQKLSPAEDSLEWSSSDALSSVSAGLERSGFEFSSEARPGFILARVKDGTGVPKALAATLPAAAKELLKEMEASGEDAQTVLVLGPKFPTGTNAIAVAADFYEGLQVLMRHRYLTKQSAFVTELESSLRNFLDSAAKANAPDIPASEFLGPALRVTREPGSRLERQIVEALRIHFAGL